MTERIKVCIDQIKSGTIPTGYKKTKIGIVPEKWTVYKLEDICMELTERAGNQEYETLSISAGIGFVNQANKFGKELSGKQYEKYIVLHRGDFSYNKGNSKRYPQGCVYMLRDRDVATVPNVFESFRLTRGISDYFEQLFVSGFLNGQLFAKINHGVRDDGLLNLRGEDFYKCYIPFPSLPEQQKIAEILSTQDRLIELKQKLLDCKKLQKKWLMQELLTGKTRLKGMGEEWKKTEIGQCGEIITGNTPATKEIENYGNEFVWVTPSDIDDSMYIFSSAKQLSKKGMGKARKLPEGSVLVTCIASIGKNAILRCEGSCNQQINAVKLNEKYSNVFFYYLVCFNKQTIKKFAGKSATQIISKEKFSNLIFNFPPLPEQTAIAEILSQQDKEIELLEKELELERQKKKALMQLLLTGKVRVK